MKKNKIVFLSIIVLILINTIIFGCYIIYKGKCIPVIMYHGIAEKGPNWTAKELFVTEKNFQKQMKYLKDHNYETIFVEDIEKNHSGKKTVVLTFDDGYVDFYTNVLPILKKYNIKANLYVITDSIDKDEYLTTSQLKEIEKSNLVSIGSHTHSHISLKGLSEYEIDYELKTSKNILESIIGKEVKTLSYPTGAYDENVLNIAKKYYNYGVTTNSDIKFMKDFNKYTISRRGMGHSSSMLDFKKILFRASLFRFGK